MPENDADLVQRTRQGDMSAFAALYDRYARLVRAVCADATHELAAAQDLAQDVFLTAFKQLHNLRSPERFAAWIVGIARLQGKHWRRGKARSRQQYSSDALDQVAYPTKPDDERLGMLLELLGGLPEKERLAIHIFYLNDLDAEQSAAIMELSRSGFYKLLASARDRLGTRFRQAQEETR